MATLFDIAIAKREVRVGVINVEVYGVSASTIIMILGRFPGIVDAYQRGGSDLIEILLENGGDAVSAAVAAVCGFPGDKAAEKQAALIPADAQIEIIMEGISLTMPEGVDPFVKKVVAVFEAFGGKLSVAQQSETSLPASEPARVYSNGHAPHHHSGAPVQ
jgi:hypothetical protein